MDSLIAIYIAWIVAQTGLSAPDHPPIHFVTPAEMAMRHGSPENSGLELQALYNRNEGSIYLPQGWRPDDLRQKSTLLHELVHHVQRSNNIVLPVLLLTNAKHTNCRSNGCGKKGDRSVRAYQNQ
ncbi:DUF6647 family protein [Bradyrhizobium sp. RDT10]